MTICICLAMVQHHKFVAQLKKTLKKTWTKSMYPLVEKDGFSSCSS